jgi:hypothetical protein
MRKLKPTQNDSGPKLTDPATASPLRAPRFRCLVSPLANAIPQRLQLTNAWLAHSLISNDILYNACYLRLNIRKLAQYETFTEGGNPCMSVSPDA